MKDNKLRYLLNNGLPSTSTRLWSAWPFFTEVVGSTGNFDYAEFMAEYSPFTMYDLENLARAAELHEMGSMIKVDFFNRGYVAQKAIAAGFQAILFSDHRNAAQVRESVQMVKPETPQDGGMFGYPSRRYIGTQSHMPQMDHAKRLRDIVLCFMIEKSTAVNEIEEICSIPGVDMIQFGPSDYSMSMGWNRSEHFDDTKAAERKCIQVALAHGVQPRCEIATVDAAQYYIDLGVRHFSLGDQLAKLKGLWVDDGAKLRTVVASLKQKMAADYIIKNGTAIDPASGFIGKADIAVKDGHIVEPCGEAACIIDAAGSYIAPALTDFHTHVFFGGSSIAVRPEFLAASGITTVCDAGTAGADNFEAFYNTVIKTSALDIRAYLNVGSVGQPGSGVNEDLNPEKFGVPAIEALFEKYGEVLRGLKIRLSKGLVPDGGAGFYPLVKTVELAERLGTGICVHTVDPPVSPGRIAAILRRGDVFCHCFHCRGLSIMGNHGILPEIIEAKKRGVLFDCANGITCFSTRIARSAIEAGFYPDIISTDMFQGNFNKKPYCMSLPLLMSKYLALGMPLIDVFRCTTLTPSAALKSRPDMLNFGADANLAIFRHVKKELRFSDVCGEIITGNDLLVPQFTMRNGSVLYCAADFWN